MNDGSGFFGRARNPNIPTQNRCKICGKLIMSDAQDGKCVSCLYGDKK